MTRLLLGTVLPAEKLLLLSMMPLVGLIGMFGWNFLKRFAAPPATHGPVEPPPVLIEERRQSARRIVTPVFVRLRGTPEDDPKREGLVCNVSLGGIGLSLKQPCAVGTVLEIRVSTAGPSVPWTEVEVRHCSPLLSRWQIGCRFVQEPPLQVRALFG